jgi:hypothetical protein
VRIIPSPSRQVSTDYPKMCALMDPQISHLSLGLPSTCVTASLGQSLQKVLLNRRGLNPGALCKNLISSWQGLGLAGFDLGKV